MYKCTVMVTPPVSCPHHPPPSSRVGAGDAAQESDAGLRIVWCGVYTTDMMTQIKLLSGYSSTAILSVVTNWIVQPNLKLFD